MKPIPFVDLRRDTSLDGELEAAFRRVLRSGVYALGPEVEAFERAAAQHLGVPHAVGVSSGSDALLATLMALGIGAGDEVVLPAFTFFATAGAVWRLGARPVFADVCPHCFHLQSKSVHARLTPRTRAVIAVHLFGRAADPAMLSLPAGCALVEDAAQAIGSSLDGKPAGTRGAAGCFSFFPTKTLGALGDGGLVATGDAALADRVRLLRQHGSRPKYHHEEVGGNFRLDALQAALLSVKLARLGEAVDARRRNARLYDEAFLGSPLAARNLPGADAALLIPDGGPGVHAYHQYVVRIRNGARDRVRRALSENGIGTEIYYPEPLHLQPCFAALGYQPGDLPNAELLASEVLALPIFPGLTADEIGRVAHALLRALA